MPKKHRDLADPATDATGVIQLFNVGAERMLGYAAADVINKITPADISDPDEVIARAKALSIELETSIAPGFEALVFKASRGIEDIYDTRSLFESKIDALMMTDPSGILTDVNKQMEALTGCTRDELIGAPFKITSSRSTIRKATSSAICC
jgi:PAS domain-containing protein